MRIPKPIPPLKRRKSKKSPLKKKKLKLRLKLPRKSKLSRLSNSRQKRLSLRLKNSFPRKKDPNSPKSIRVRSVFAADPKDPNAPNSTRGKSAYAADPKDPKDLSSTPGKSDIADRISLRGVADKVKPNSKVKRALIVRRAARKALVRKVRVKAASNVL